jgi:acyl-coenzyme A synthetase/AMP-(fatty) acid ligase
MSNAMADHSVFVDRSSTPADIQYSPVFNVAVPMIDRHLENNRGAYTAIINTDATESADIKITYQQLAERVNQCGNLLRSFDSQPGDRILMVVKD